MQQGSAGDTSVRAVDYVIVGVDKQCRAPQRLCTWDTYKVGDMYSKQAMSLGSRDGYVFGGSGCRSLRALSVTIRLVKHLIREMHYMDWARDSVLGSFS